MREENEFARKHEREVLQMQKQMNLQACQV